MQRRLAFAKSLSEEGVPCAAPDDSEGAPTIQAERMSRARMHWLLVASRVRGRTQAGRLAVALNHRMSRTRKEHTRLQRVAAVYTMTRLRKCGKGSSTWS